MQHIGDAGNTFLAHKMNAIFATKHAWTRNSARRPTKLERVRDWITDVEALSKFSREMLNPRLQST